MASYSTQDQTINHEKSNVEINELQKTTTGTTGVSTDDSTNPEAEGMNLNKWLSLAACAILWTGSQIPLYLYGGIPPYIYEDLGGVDRWIWFVLANLLALAAVCPFVGSLSDLFGRRYVAIGGAILLILGNIITSTAHSMNTFICGMAIAGAGAGLNELVALAITSEIAPTRKRGLYNCVMVFTIIPFCPSVLWGQLIASKSKGAWRYIGAWCGAWAALGLIMTVLFYHPPPRVNSVGMSKKEVLRRVDYVGGLLSVSGLIVFLAALQWGGYNYPWSSAHVIAPLVVGILLLIGFVVWEVYFAPYPMIPKALFKQEPRIMALTLAITAISGSNFFSVLLFWPTQSYNVYGHEPTQVGIRNITLGFSILAGACIVLFLLSYTRGHIRGLMIVSTVLMTAGCGSMAALNRDNLWLVYVTLTIGGLGIGGIVVPSSIITTIVCPDELIATVTSISLAIRVVGGAVGYCIYYNVFSNRFVDHAKTVLAYKAAVILETKDVKVLTEVIEITASGILPLLRELPGVGTDDQVYNALVRAGQETYAYAYPYVYYVSIAFGSIAIICSMFLGDIRKYMNDHVAVSMA